LLGILLLPRMTVSIPSWGYCCHSWTENVVHMAWRNTT